MCVIRCEAFGSVEKSFDYGRGWDMLHAGVERFPSTSA